MVSTYQATVDDTWRLCGVAGGVELIIAWAGEGSVGRGDGSGITTAGRLRTMRVAARTEAQLHRSWFVICPSKWPELSGAAGCRCQL